MFKVGDNIGRYALLRRLAGGGMGEVFLAAQKGAAGLGPPVALKVLRQELASDASFVQMMIDEAKISMFLNHQNIVSVLDFAEEDGAYYIAMEYVQGATVERLVDELKSLKQKLDVSIALFIGIEICRALKYAHACTNHLGEALNIVHRDVTPANVLLSIQGEVKLTDFGIARAKGRIHQTQAGVVKGKFGYLAPEIARYEQIDARADLFSLGVVLYQLLAGQHPIAGASVMEAIFRFEEKQLPKPSQFNPEISPAVEAIILRALEPRPADRWSSSQELQVALQEAAMNDATSRRGMPNAAQSLAALLKTVIPEVLEDPVPPEMPRDPTLPPGYASFSTKIFTSSKEPVPRVPSASVAGKKKPLPGIPVDASFVELIPGGRTDKSAGKKAGGAFGESTTTDMPSLPDPGSGQMAGLLDAPVIDGSDGSPTGDFEEQATAFDEPTATNLDSFGAETSQDVPQLPDPNEERDIEASTDSSEFGDSTRVDRAYDAPKTTTRGAAFPQVASSGVGEAQISGSGFGDQTIAGSSFGDRTLADNSFRALTSPVHPRVEDPGSLDLPQTPAISEADASDSTLSMSPVVASASFGGSGFGDNTVADPSFRALVAPTDTLRDEDADDDDLLDAPVQPSDMDEGGFEPTRIRETDSSSKAQREAKVPVPKITVPPIATTVDPQREEEELPRADSEDAFGGNTQKWIAGQIDGKQLSWSDDDAARRAVETRNTVKGASNPSPAPAQRPSAVAVRATSRTAQAGQSPAQSPPPTHHQAPPPPVSPFAPLDVPTHTRSKKGPVIAAFVALAVGVGTLAGALIYPTLFAPALSISTSPPGANVSINGARLRGVTPLVLEVEPEVEQHIEIALEGHQTVVRDITAIERGQTYAINVTLEMLEPEIRISPGGGRVFINGREIGSGVLVRVPGIDPNAPAELRVEAPGFELFRAEFSRGSQIPAILDVVLKKR